MKRKHLIVIALAAIVLLSLTWVVYSNWHQLFPSQQMKELRRLETSLNLPEPKHRVEKDVAYYKDSKGALHYERHIALSYGDASVLDSLRVKLLKDGWEEKPMESYGSPPYSFLFSKGTGDSAQCVGGYTDPRNQNIPLYISLEAPGEYSCNPAPGI